MIIPVAYVHASRGISESDTLAGKSDLQNER